MDLFAGFSDDQIAVIGCFGALAVCGVIAMISFQFGPQGKKGQPATRLPLREQSSTESQDFRKAA